MPTTTRPAKRQRRSKVISDEDDEPSNSSTGLPLRNQPLRQTNVTKASQSVSKLKPVLKHGRTASNADSTNSSTKSSPEKSRKKVLEDSKTKSINSFFGRVTDQDRWRQRSNTPDSVKREEVDTEDIIDDESMDEALQEVLRHSKQDMPDKENEVVPAQQLKASGSLTSSQRFRKPAMPVRKQSVNGKNATIESHDIKPWAEQYSPETLDELAVNKKKAQDVERWLDGAVTGRSGQRILVLKGPAGAGKSTTVQLIAKTNNLDLLHWQNPDTSESGSLSSSLQFAEFIILGAEYGALSLNGQQSSLTKADSRILMVEDFPAAITRSSTALDSFRAALSHAASANTAAPVFHGQAGGLPPVVLVVSETLVSSSTALSDSFTAQRLLGAELINHPAVSVIDFNPVAPTFLSKALDLVIRKEARVSGRRRIPGSAILSHLAEIGDVRNAINSLQLLCARGDENSDWSGTVATNAKRSAKSTRPLSKMEQDSLKLLSSRESTLDMFHAAGKVCYNKREDPQLANSRAEPVPEPPEHLRYRHRPKVSQVNVEDLLNETGTDIQTFIATLQQNYVLSCNHFDFVDYFDGCASVLSDAELLDPDSRMSVRTKARAYATQNQFQLGTSDALRQDEISFQLATRGVLFNLPFPVSRAVPPGAGKGAAFKMYYPVSLRLWRPIEEMNGLLDLIIAKETGQSGKSRAAASGVEDDVSLWKARSNAFQAGLGARMPEQDDIDVVERTEMSKETLIMESLPYVTRIGISRHQDVNLSRKITQLCGFNVTVEQEPDEDSNLDQDQSLLQTSDKAQAAHRSLSSEVTGVQFKHEGQASSSELPEEKLYIDDDDIEDD